MEKSLNYCLKTVALLVCACFFSCQPTTTWYQKEFSAEEHELTAEMLTSGMGYRYYYQGSAGEQAIVNEAAKHSPNHPEVWRERGIPYLKRGMAGDFYPPYKKCVELDPLNWQGYRGYCYLYFYRDYERALTDFDALDVLTPNFIDHPQAQSIDFMRAICYYGMGNYSEALNYIDKHIAEETKQVGVDYIDKVSFVLKGNTHEKLGQLADAKTAYELGIKIHERTAGLKYYLASLLKSEGESQQATKLLAEAQQDYKDGYFSSRPYVEEFFQVYEADLLYHNL